MSQKDPQGMDFLLEQFLEWLAMKNYTETTIQARRTHLGYFMDWAAARGIHRPSEVSKPVVERYQRFLFNYRKRNGQPLTFGVQNNRLVAVRSWFKWLSRNNHILYNPTADLDLARPEFRLLKCVLTEKEAEAVINQTDVRTSQGIRDRAILEVFYSTAMRRMELIGLRPHDLDLERGTITIRQGKGKKDRVVPVGDRAVSWLQRYMDEVRPTLLTANEDALFLNNVGHPFSPNRLTMLVAGYVDAADLGKHGACHSFRHTTATLMLENGADIRFIQQMLGHTDLKTTQIYTRVSIRKLKEVHNQTHPARLKRPQ